MAHLVSPLFSADDDDETSSQSSVVINEGQDNSLHITRGSETPLADLFMKPFLGGGPSLLSGAFDAEEEELVGEDGWPLPPPLHSSSSLSYLDGPGYSFRSPPPGTSSTTSSMTSSVSTPSSTPPTPSRKRPSSQLLAQPQTTSSSSIPSHLYQPGEPSPVKPSQARQYRAWALGGVLGAADRGRWAPTAPSYNESQSGNSRPHHPHHHIPQDDHSPSSLPVSMSRNVHQSPSLMATSPTHLRAASAAAAKAHGIPPGPLQDSLLDEAASAAHTSVSSSMPDEHSEVEHDRVFSALSLLERNMEQRFAAIRAVAAVSPPPPAARHMSRRGGHHIPTRGGFLSPPDLPDVTKPPTSFDETSEEHERQLQSSSIDPASTADVIGQRARATVSPPPSSSLSSTTTPQRPASSPPFDSPTLQERIPSPGSIGVGSEDSSGDGSDEDDELLSPTTSKAALFRSRHILHILNRDHPELVSAYSEATASSLPLPSPSSTASSSAVSSPTAAAAAGSSPSQVDAGPSSPSISVPVVAARAINSSNAVFQGHGRSGSLPSTSLANFMKVPASGRPRSSSMPPRRRTALPSPPPERQAVKSVVRWLKKEIAALSLPGSVNPSTSAPPLPAATASSSTSTSASNPSSRALQLTQPPSNPSASSAIASTLSTLPSSYSPSSSPSLPPPAPASLRASSNSSPPVGSPTSSKKTSEGGSPSTHVRARPSLVRSGSSNDMASVGSRTSGSSRRSRHRRTGSISSMNDILPESSPMAQASTSLRRSPPSSPSKTGLPKPVLLSSASTSSVSPSPPGSGWGVQEIPSTELSGTNQGRSSSPPPPSSHSFSPHSSSSVASYVSKHTSRTGPSKRVTFLDDGDEPDLALESISFSGLALDGAPNKSGSQATLTKGILKNPFSPQEVAACISQLYNT